MFLRKDDFNLTSIYESIYSEEDEQQSISDVKGLVGDKERVGEYKGLTDKEYGPIKEKLIRARRMLKKFDLDLGLYLDTMRIVLTKDDAKCNTMAVDDIGNIYMNIDFLMNQLTLRETVGVLAHEVAHIYNLTFPRRKGRIFKLWNIATDYAQNRDILRAGLELPAIGLIPKQENGRWYVRDYGLNIDITDAEAPETIYALIAEELKKQMGDTPQPPQPQPKAPDEPIKVGGVIRDTISDTYGRVTAIDTTTGEVDFDPMTKEEVKRHFAQIAARY